MHKTELVSGPADEPITIGEAKEHLNISIDSPNDTYIDSLILSARTQVERYLNRALITQSWKVYYDAWCHEMFIPFGRLQIAGASPGPASPVVKYYDSTGAQQTLTESSYYWVVTSTDPARIVRKYDAVYPELQLGRPDAIEISFICGYGNGPDSVPVDIRHGIKRLLTHYFTRRGDDDQDSRPTTTLPEEVVSLIHSYKLYQF